MSKMGIIVTVSALVLISLFVTMIILLQTVDPPYKSDNDTGRFEDEDYSFNANDALIPSDDKLGYGLEKITIEYDLVDVDSKSNSRLKLKRNNTEVRGLLTKHTATESTRGPVINIEPLDLHHKPIKEFRRSINAENLLESNKAVPRSLLLKITGLDGKPGIEIKLLSEKKLKNKRRNIYNTSNTKIKTASNLSEINFDVDSDNSVKGASILIAENSTFIVNIFANSIDIVKGDNIEPNKFAQINTSILNNSIKKDKTFATDSSFFRWYTEVESAMNETISTNMFTLNFVNNSSSNTNISVVQDSIKENLGNNTLSTRKYKSNTINNNKNQQDISGSPVRDEIQTVSTKYEDESLLTLDIKNETSYATENVGTVFIIDETHASDNEPNLLGLLVPKAAATLPINSWI